MTVTIRPMLQTDWETVRRIYIEGIETSNATFETRIPDWETWDAGHLPDCRLVACVDDEVVGWVAVSPVSKRHVYRGVVEHSIYVASSTRGMGVGKTLMGALIRVSEEAGFWMLQTSIFPENTISLALHKQFGFREVGYRSKIAQLHGKWRDTILLERRSVVIGNS